MTNQFVDRSDNSSFVHSENSSDINISTSSRNNSAAKLSIEILQLAFADYGERDFSVRLWNGEQWPASPGKEVRFTLKLNHPGALRRMFFPPSELALGEAFVRGDFDVEGDLVACIGLNDAIQSLLANPRRWSPILFRLSKLPKEKVVLLGQHGAVHLKGEVHSETRDGEAISYHYDLPPEFYAVFLDRNMQYSCGYFPAESATLDSAQEAKLEHICRKLRLQPGERLLDIGCGWGGLIRYAASHFGVDAVGITLSREQAEFGQRRIEAEGLADHCRIEIRDYREIDESFDKIVSVGMVEHVGKAKLSVYYGKAFELLRPGGLFLCHGIAGMLGKKPGLIEKLVQKALNRKGGFLENYVFPDGELVPLYESTTFAENVGFEVRDVEGLREHYAMTLRNWLRALEARRDEVLRIVDVPTHRIWRLYIAGCAHFFDANRLNLYQMLLVKPDSQGKSGMPLTRQHIYENR